MTRHYFSPRLPWAALAVVLAAALAPTGCQQQPEQVAHYQVPRVQDPPDELPADQVKERTLAVKFERPGRVWFFKLSGPAALVAEHEKAFDAFIQTVRFEEDAEPPVKWEAPKEWAYEAGQNDIRFGTFRLGKDKTADLTVTSFANYSGAELADVNRWRKELGRKPVTTLKTLKEGDLRRFEVAGVKALRVSLVGPGGDKGMAAPFAKGAPVAKIAPRPPAKQQQRQEEPLTYKAPPGWTELPPGTVQFSLASFAVRDGERTARVTVSPVGGRLEDNLNRWRGQVGLPNVADAQVRKEMKPTKVAGQPAHYVDYAGPRGDRILGAVAERGDAVWYIKMTGPAELLAKQQAAFETFVGSLQFGAAKGGD